MKPYVSYEIKCFMDIYLFLILFRSCCNIAHIASRLKKISQVFFVLFPRHCNFLCVRLSLGVAAVPDFCKRVLAPVDIDKFVTRTSASRVAPTLPFDVRKHPHAQVSCRCVARFCL